MKIGFYEIGWGFRLVKDWLGRRIDWYNPYTKIGVIAGIITGAAVFYIYELLSGGVSSLFAWGWNNVSTVWSWTNGIWEIAWGLALFGAIGGAILGFIYLGEEHGLGAVIIGAIGGAIGLPVIAFLVMLLVVAIVAALAILLLLLILIGVILGFIAAFTALGIGAGKVAEKKVKDVRLTKEERQKTIEELKALKAKIAKARDAGIEPAAMVREYNELKTALGYN